MHRIELELYLADLLDTPSFEDKCVNGLQVEGKETIQRVVTGVTVSERLLYVAAEKRADAVIVHHGLFWKNSPHPFVLTGLYYKRIKILIDYGINLFAYHLPLDGHQVLGNSVIMAKKLGLDDITFASLDGCRNPIAVVGEFTDAMNLNEFPNFADEALESKGMFINLNFKPVKRLFVLSGGGGAYYQDAHLAGADTMVTGELTESSVRSAEELGLNLYASGHYNSERWGIKALGEHIATQFNIDVDFVDIPNPI